MSPTPASATASGSISGSGSVPGSARGTGDGAVRARRRERTRRLLFRAAATAVVVWSVAPFLWQLSSSFQLDRDLASRTPHWLPVPGTLDHYRSVFGGHEFGAYLTNSVIVTVGATFVGLLLASLATYALARLPVPGKGAVLALVLGLSMFPQISIVVPLYLALNRLGLLDTYHGLGGTYVGLALPLMIFVLYAHFRSLPAQLDEAAAIDGAGLLRTLRSIVLPLALPGIAAAAMLGFITNWNEFMLALAFTSSPEHQTVPVGIANFQSQYFIPWGDMAAASVVVTLPLVVLVVVFQRRIVAGVTSGAVKE